MLMKQIVKCKTLSAESANSYLQIKNINMISKIVFRIRFRLFWFLSIRIQILIILNLIWIDIINIFVVEVEIFYNMIWSDKVEWLWLIFSDSFVLILITMKVDFLSEVWIDWSWLWCSCCVNDNHQRLLWSWQSWLIISRCQILKYEILLLNFVLSIAVVFLWKSFTLWEIHQHEIKLKIRNMYKWLIIWVRFILCLQISSCLLNNNHLVVDIFVMLSENMICELLSDILFDFKFLN